MKIRNLMALGLAAGMATAAVASPDGERLYQAYCVQCHGVQGDGNGINAAHLSVQPRSHIDQEEMSARTDDELYRVIEQGGVAINKSVLMPPWGGNLDETEINALVGYLRVLCCEE
jgi:cytochrome c oxidase cbb3-type subunit 3